MENNYDECIQQIKESISKLPEKVQKAFVWMIVNYEEVEELCKGRPLLEETRRQLMEAARRNDDALLFVLLVAEKVINAQQNEPQEK